MERDKRTQALLARATRGLNDVLTGKARSQAGPQTRRRRRLLKELREQTKLLPVKRLQYVDWLLRNGETEQSLLRAGVTKLVLPEGSQEHVLRFAKVVQEHRDMLPAAWRFVGVDPALLGLDAPKAPEILFETKPERVLRVSSEQNQRVWSLYSAGAPVSEIAKQEGLTTSAVRCRIRRMEDIFAGWKG